jgi:hypothetical protein
MTVARHLREKTITDLNNLLQYMAEIKDEQEFYQNGQDASARIAADNERVRQSNIIFAQKKEEEYHERAVGTF